MSRRWYAFFGPVGGELNSTYYSQTSIKPTCFEGSPDVCSIYAKTNATYGNNPVPLSTNLITYIANAKATSLAQPIGIGVKKYVYTLPGGL
jgi:hypothetical protein